MLANPSLRTDGSHDANFIVIDDTNDCHNDDLRFHQWRKSWHHGNTQFSVSYDRFNYRSNWNDKNNCCCCLLKISDTKTLLSRIHCLYIIYIAQCNWGFCGIYINVFPISLRWAYRLLVNETITLQTESCYNVNLSSLTSQAFVVVTISGAACNNDKFRI